MISWSVRKHIKRVHLDHVRIRPKPYNGLDGDLLSRGTQDSLVYDGIASTDGRTADVVIYLAVEITAVPIGSQQ